MKWLIDPSEYTLPNPRIDGWKKLREVSGRTVQIFVFPLEVFNFFLQNRKLPAEFESELLVRAREMIESSPEHSALVRRAFVVPGMENPPGPRFLGLNTPEKVIDATVQLYEFAIKQNYHSHADSQISGWIEPPSTVLDLDKFNVDPASVRIPYGGYAVNENGTVEILAVYGANEGVQSLVADRYIVESRRERLFVIKKEVPQKNQMLCTTKTAGIQLVNVPIDLQFDQVFSDSEIVEVARVTHELSKKYGPQRVEFSTDSQGICFNEVANYYREEKKSTGDLKVTGKVLLVNGLDDLNKLKTIPGEQLENGEVVVMVGEKVVIDRDYDVLGTLTTWKNHMFVLYPGVASTQHAVRVLADKGHKAFLVGNQKYADGDQVQISSGGGKVRVTNLTRTESQETMSLWDALLFGNEMCGGKAYRLSHLKTNGFQVPHGVVCTTVVFDNLQKSKTKAEKLKYLDTLLPEYRNSDNAYAVRSSATIEDGRTHSMAGMFDSFLNVAPHDLSENILRVIESSNNKSVTDYISHHSELKAMDLKMAVVVQQMVPARAAGVIFGVKTQTSDSNLVEIEINNGLGEAIVSGTATEVEYYRFSRYERKLVERKGPKYISEAEARALFMLSERLREMYSDIPQDIEWAIDKEGQIWVLQSRDMNIA